MKDVFQTRQANQIVEDPTLSGKVMEYFSLLLTGAAQARKGAAVRLEAMSLEALLPGIIQCAYVYWDRIKNEAAVRKMMGDIIRHRCIGNDVGRLFLVRHGIAHNPFPDSRRWILEQYATFPEIQAGDFTEQEKNLLLNPSPMVSESSPFLEEFLELHHRIAPSETYSRVKESIAYHLKKDTQFNLRKATELYHEIMNWEPGPLHGLTVFFFESIPKSGNKDFKKDYCEILKSKEHPPILARESLPGYISGCEDILEKTRNNRNKYVEFHFINAVVESLKKNPDLVEELDQIMVDTEYLYRYWFQALTYCKTNHVESYLSTRDYSECEENVISRIIFQNIFLKNKGLRCPSWLQNQSHRLEEDHPDLLSEAEELYERLRPTNFGERADKGGEETAELEKFD